MQIITQAPINTIAAPIISHLSNYFWLPTGFTDLTSANGVKGGFWGAFFFVLGKITIAFRISQTIAAFRKYL